MKKLLCLLVVLLLCTPVAAAEIPDPETTGSIVFTLDFDGQPLDGGSLEIYRVAALISGDHDSHFEPVEELADSAPTLGDLTDPTLAETFARLLEQQQVQYLSAPIKNGRAVFENLLPGVYLVIQREENATADFSALQSFLVSLPQWREDRYVYDLVLEPKVALETKPTEPTEPSEPTEPTKPNLPQTGQLVWPIPLLCVSGFGLFVLGFYLCFGKKRDHET